MFTPSAQTASAIELALGYSQNYLNTVAVEWFKNTFTSNDAVSQACDFVDDQVVPHQGSGTPQITFNGAVSINNHTGLPVLLTLGPIQAGGAFATLTLPFVGTYCDNSGSPAVNQTFTAQAPLTVTITAKLATTAATAPSADSPQAANLTNVFGNQNWQTQLTFLNVTLSPTEALPTINWSANQPAVMIMAGCFALWLKSVLEQFALLSLAQATSSAPTTALLIPFAYELEVLPAGTANGQTYPNSLIVAGQLMSPNGLIHVPMPNPLSSIVPDAGHLFELNPLSPDQAPSAADLPTAKMAIGPLSAALHWVANMMADPNLPGAITPAICVVSGPGANWTIGSTQFGVSSLSPLDPALNNGLCLNYTASKDTTGDGTFSTAWVTDGIALSLAWSVASNNTPLLTASFIRTFSCQFNGVSECFIQTQGPVTVPWTVNFTISCLPNASGTALQGNYYGNQFTYAAVSCSYYGYPPANDALIETLDNIDAPATLLQNVQKYANLPVVADINCTTSNLILDTQYRLNMNLALSTN